MKKTGFLYTSTTLAGLGALFWGLTGGALAAGFALNEQSGSGMGVAFAGSAASGEDASTVFYNPAAMVLISGTQLSLGAHGVIPSLTFNNAGSFTAGGPLTGNDGSGAAKGFVVPNFYLVTDISPDIKYGFGVSTPFGLLTEYNGTWVGRYQALKSQLQTFDLNPSLAFKLSDHVSFGGGFNAQYINASLSRAIDFGLISGGVPQSADGAVEAAGNSWAYGYNLGALFQFSTATRVGVAYRSPVHQTLVGSASFSNVPAALVGDPRFANSKMTAAITLPDTISLSAVQAIGERWELLSDLTFTRWSYFNQIALVFANGQTSVTPENWRNTFRGSLGATYRYTDRLKLRGGIGFDQSPVRDGFRTAAIPDSHRKLLAAGLNYKYSKADSVDLAYQHLFFNNGGIANNQLASGGGFLVGTFSADANILSLQYNHEF
ncbi:MAG TPA: outer membrane protein transport protein [Burkholderiales bacterium]|nr:outer membrane protein transport protein [Burkholderiales bacterium]